MPDEAPLPGFHVPFRLGERVVGWLATDVAALAAALPALTPPETGPPRLLLVPAGPEVLAVRTGRRGFAVVPQASITYATSLGGLVTIHVDAGRYRRDGSLAETEGWLDPRRFLRLDQSHLINVTRIGELVPWTHQRYQLLFADAGKTELVVSRDVGRRLRATLGW